MAEAVIGGALLIVLQDVVGLADFLEFLLGALVARVAVRVMLHRELAIGLLQLVGARRFGHAEDLVKVLLSHGRRAFGIEFRRQRVTPAEVRRGGRIRFRHLRGAA